MLFEPRVVSRDFSDSWGRRRIDLALIYDLRVNQGLTFLEISRRLALPKATVIDNLRKAARLFGGRGL